MQPAPVSEFSLCPELLASSSSTSEQLEAQRGDWKGWGQVAQTAGRLDHALPSREWDTEPWSHLGASRHPAAMPSGPGTALGTRRGTLGCPPCTVRSGFSRPYQLPAGSRVSWAALEAAAGHCRTPGHRELLLLPPLFPSPLRVTRKSPRSCCQSIFDSSANLTLFSSL